MGGDSSFELASRILLSSLVLDRGLAYMLKTGL